MADRRAYISALTEPTAPEILAWLGILPLREQLLTLHATVILQRGQSRWARIAAAHDYQRWPRSQPDPRTPRSGFPWQE